MILGWPCDMPIHHGSVVHWGALRHQFIGMMFTGALWGELAGWNMNIHQPNKKTLFLFEKSSHSPSYMVKSLQFTQIYVFLGNSYSILRIKPPKKKPSTLQGTPSSTSWPFCRGGNRTDMNSCTPEIWSLGVHSAFERLLGILRTTCKQHQALLIMLSKLNCWITIWIILGNA